MIRETETVTAGGSPVYRCALADGSGDLDVLFLGRATVAGLTVGTRCRLQGTVTRRGGRLAVWNPRYQLEPRMHGARGGVLRASRPGRNLLSRRSWPSWPELALRPLPMLPC